jgi:hypothetical protein
MNWKEVIQMPELFKDHIYSMEKFLNAIENDQSKMPRSHLDILKNALSLIKDNNPMVPIYCMGHATEDFRCNICCSQNCGDYEDYSDPSHHKNDCKYILTIRDLEAWIQSEEEVKNG